ncbi:phospholipase A1 [Lucilia sericata]|uniref:phospholipase A1 n=1 Tax=Lucilia sericata TaxID=13632 RepID=UPI0018A83AC0|nr:phospholipase A1 [Lucilia sericata]
MWISWEKTVAIYFLACICALNVKGETLDDVESVDDPIKFYVYTRQNNVTPQILQADVESIVRSVLNPSKQTTLAIHGILGNKSSEECLIIKEEKLKVEDANIIIVDYSSLMDGKDFGVDFISADLVAKSITDLVILLKESFNMNIQNIHIVGFSLGGQIAGLAGQNIYERCGEKINRITALDPAGILFTENTPANEKLTADDADYVEVVHTNAGEYGYETPCGHVDYYPNGGKIQPGCISADNACSHNRAYKFIPEMWSPVKHQEFLLLKCENLEFMSLDSCRWQNEIMGELGQQQKGLYYVETNDNIPFGKGAFKKQFL